MERAPIDERLDALRDSVELLLLETREQAAIVREHSKQLATDSDNIRTLARIAEIHERRLTDVEGGDV